MPPPSFSAPGVLMVTRGGFRFNPDFRCKTFAAWGQDEILAKRECEEQVRSSARTCGEHGDRKGKGCAKAHRFGDQAPDLLRRLARIVELVRGHAPQRVTPTLPKPPRSSGPSSRRRDGPPFTTAP